MADLRTALLKIAALNPGEDSEEGWNEWGESDCFMKAQDIANAALAAAPPQVQPLSDDARRYQWLRDHPLWSVGYRVKPRTGVKEWRMRDEGEYWGEWWPTHEQAVDHAMHGSGQQEKP